MRVDHYPQEDTKLRADSTLIAGGGPCATGLAAVARLGVSAAYMGNLGGDSYGAFMLEDFKRFGVQTKYIRTVADTQSAHGIVWLSETKPTRTCVWSPGTVPPPKPEELDAQALRRAKVLHLDGHHIEAAIAGAKIIHEAGGLVSHDAGGNYPGIEKLLPYVDLLIPSEEFALKQTGETTAEAAAEKLSALYHPKVLVITQGKRGGLLFENGRCARYPAFPVEAVDTNGAGDVFHGAFVVGTVRGMNPLKAATFASAVSALKCTHFGARAGVPSFENAVAFLRERGEAL